MKFFPLALSLSLLCGLSLSADPFVIDLKEPEYLNGVLRTEKGGVISAPNLRIQAEKIEYTNTKIEGVAVHKIIAEGNVMMNYEEKLFIGNRLEFDLINNQGFLECGHTSVGIWFIGGDRIEFCKEGGFVLYGGYITTCESGENPWEIRAHKATLDRCNILTASDVRFNVKRIPFFWLPFYKSNLQRMWESPVRLRLLWDTKLGPRLSMRYRFYSNEVLDAFLRFDYRITRGPGGAIETDYESLDGMTTFVSRNYGALDKSFPNEKGPVRFRFQGMLDSSSFNGKTNFHAQWDRMSDDRMVSDFKSSDFEINTEKESYVFFSHQEDDSYATVNFRPRINRFQSLNQQLPSVMIGIRPFEIFKTGVISENWVNGSYLDYTYAYQLDDKVPDRKSGRLETYNTLYRPFNWGALSFIPKASLVAIYYSQSPLNEPTGQLLLSYGGYLNSRLTKYFESFTHHVEPYCDYLGYSRPQTPVNRYFVFDINDGYTRLDQLRFGIRQLFFPACSFVPGVTLDLYTYAFWGAKSFYQRIPKAFADLQINQSSFYIRGRFGWNIQQKLLDYGNLEFLYTVNEAVAFGFEMRHRSAYDWRKANHEDYVVDFARSRSALLNSPLSDRRSTFLAKAHFHFSPRWNLHFQMHHGWDRKNEPAYTGVKFDLFTRLDCNWQMRLSYEYVPNDPFRFTYNFNIVN